MQTVTGGSQCTANFVFTDGTGAVYLGQSAHCAGTGGATETDGCIAGSLPLGTRVEIDGASQPGTLVYSSWLAMQAAKEKDANACAYNDFALVRLDPSDIGRTNPSVPVFGGPVGLDTDGTSVGEQVVTYGNSSLRFGLESTSPKRGVSLGDAFGGWTHTVYTVTPGIPGDSGSGVLDAAGRAIGTLSTVAVLPYPASNGVSDLARQIAYARGHGVPGLTLVPGTEAFAGVL
ncbi:MAG: serine protease [Frankiales bacterium]|nr:MAG: serine protease [Frankiales bacterium]